MLSFRVLNIAFVGISLAACAGNDTDDSSNHTELTLATYTPTHRASSGNTINLTCDKAEPTNGPSATSADDLMSHIDGIWLRCDGGSSPFVEADGVEVDVEGRAFSLKRNAAGTLERRTGFANESFFEAWQNGDRWDAYQVLGDSGFYPRGTWLSESRNTWKSEFPGGGDLLVRSSEKVDAPPTGLPGARLGADGCALPEAGIHTPKPSPEEFTTLLHGKWLACGTRFFADASGFEFTDTEWFALEDGPNGSLVRTTNPQHHGTIRYDGKSVPALVTAGDGGSYATPIAFSAAPVKLQIYNMGSGPYVYSALP